MILGLWQHSKGFVRIKVTGFGLERFLNMAAFRGIYMWDVQRVPEGVTLSVSIPGFKMLKGCGRKTKCRTKIIEKHGLPFILHRYRKRKLLMGGILFFILGMFALSSFVWRIDIVGNESLSQESVMAFVNEQGLHIGAPKWNLQDTAIQQSILSHFPELSWADVYTRGTRTTIMLSEALPPQSVVDRQTPAHVIAASDGLITSIATASGAPMVRQNDIVRQGELLVSGILELDPNMPGTALVYVHAYAEVWARRYYPIEFAVPLTYTERIFTGRTVRHRALNFLFIQNAVLPLPRGAVPFESYERVTTRRQPGVSGDYPLPVVLITDHIAEFMPESRTRTIEEAKELADRMITGRIIREFDFAIDIIGREVHFSETEDALIVSALITTHERIDRQIPVGVESLSNS